MGLTLAGSLALLIQYKYAILFPALIVEGPIITVLAAFLASPGGGSILHIVPVFWIVVAADIIGDAFYYSLGRWGRRWRKMVGISEEKLNKVERYFENHGPKTLAVAKISHGLGWITMVGAGSARMPFGKFMAVSSLISIPKSLLLLALGYYYGKSYEALGQYMNSTALMITSVLLFAFIVYIFKLRKAARI